MMDILVMDCAKRKKFWITLKSENKIHYATTAKEGLNLISNNNVGLVFLNIRLPDMNGVEVLRLIKKKYPSISVIIITSCGIEACCFEGSRKLTRDHIRKPLNPEEILHKIKALLDTPNTVQRRRYLQLSSETLQNEHRNDIPYHFLSGILKVRDFIDQNHAESLSLSDACKMASLCKTYFCRYFKLITGHSLRSYHHVVKVRLAEELLKEKKLSVTEVAQRLGYSDSNYFSTIYKKIIGISPRKHQTSVENVREIDWMITDSKKDPCRAYSNNREVVI